MVSRAMVEPLKLNSSSSFPFPLISPASFDSAITEHFELGLPSSMAPNRAVTAALSSASFIIDGGQRGILDRSSAPPLHLECQVEIRFCCGVTPPRPSSAASTGRPPPPMASTGCPPSDVEREEPEMNSVAKKRSNQALASSINRRCEFSTLPDFDAVSRDPDRTNLVKIHKFRSSVEVSPRFPTPAESTGRPPPPMASATSQSTISFVAAPGRPRTTGSSSARVSSSPCVGSSSFRCLLSTSSSIAELAPPQFFSYLGGDSAKHEAMGEEWLQSGNCPIAKSYRAVSRVIPLVASALQPPPGMKFKCPPAIVAARAALARTALVKNLRPQPLPAKMLAIGALGIAANIPLGIWREHTAKFSLSWFTAVHASVPFIAMLRKSVVMPKEAMALTIAASILGQVIGSRAERIRLKAEAGREKAAAVVATAAASGGEIAGFPHGQAAAASRALIAERKERCGTHSRTRIGLRLHQPAFVTESTNMVGVIPIWHNIKNKTSCQE